jgi:hypothetical protein
VTEYQPLWTPLYIQPLRTSVFYAAVRISGQECNPEVLNGVFVSLFGGSDEDVVRHVDLLG